MQKDKKTIGITIRFFTNDLPDRVGAKKGLIPFWTVGNVHLEANKTKGIKTQDEIFNYFEDIPRAMKTVLSRGKLVAVEDVAYSMKAEKRRNKKS
jgi:hypothetical protein